MKKTNSSMNLLVLAAVLAVAGAQACGEDEAKGAKSTGGAGGTGGSTVGGTGGTGATGTGGSGGTSASGGGGSGGTAGSGGSSGAAGASGSAATDAGTDADAGGDGEAGVSNVAYPGAPPTMLHNPYGCTNNCVTCHGQGTGNAPKTPHPERLLCRQCHLPQANVPLFVENTFGK